MKKILLVLTLLLFSLFSFSQLSNKHWIPPLHSRNGDVVSDHYIYLSTPSATPFAVSVKTGNGTPITGSPFTISQGNPVRVLIGNTQPSPMFLDINDVNTVESDKGLILEGSKDFYVSFRVRSANHAEILVSKGKTAKGTNFRLGSVPQLYDSSIRNFVSSFMATEDNTTVNLTDYDPSVVFVSGSGNITLNSQTFTLNAGQSVVVSGYTDVAANFTGFIGTLLTSDKPIVVNSGNATGGAGPDPGDGNSGQDFNLDQIVPFNQIGTKYIVVKGNGSANSERPLIIATEDNTEVYTNGNTSPIVTLNTGDYFLIPSLNYQGFPNPNMYIESSKPIYVYQILAGNTNDATSGLNFIPPLSCYWQRNVDLIPDFNKIGNVLYNQSRIIIVTEVNSQVTINNSPITATPQAVQGNLGWETYKVSGLNGNITVESTGALAVGVFGTDGDAAGFGGYFSGFGSEPEDTNITICTNTTIDLLDAIEGNPSEGGSWSPTLSSGTNMFDPSVDMEGTYTYNYDITCDGITVSESVDISVVFEEAPDIGSDATISFCTTDTAVDLFSLLNTTNTTGIWSHNGTTRPNGILNPGSDNSGDYVYTIFTNGICQEVSATVSVTINQIPTINTITPLETCDDSVDGDTSGESLFILTDKDLEIVGNSSNILNIKYYELITDAENAAVNNINTIRAVTGKIIYYRITDENGCYAIGAFELIVNPLPIANEVLLRQCDTDNDAITIFNLNEATQLISTETNTSLTYHNSQNGALSLTDFVNDITNYTAANGSSVWARIENIITGCLRVVKVDLVVSTTVVAGSYPFILNTCDNYLDATNTDTDGIDIFDLTEIENYILSNSNFPSGQSYTFSYYENSTDALAEQNAISNPQSFTNTIPNTQTIWVRIDSDINNDCVGLGAYLTLKVNPIPDIELGADFSICVNPVTGVGSQVINASPSTNGNYSYQWSTDIASLDLSSQTNATYLVSNEGTYYVTVTNNITNCQNTDSITVSFSSEPATFTAEVTSPAFSSNTTAILGIAEGGYGEYEYSIDGSNWQTSNQFEGLPLGTYTIYVRDQNKCGVKYVSDLFTITYPKYFTPNGDGFHDTWNIMDLDKSYNALVTIYDRYGKLIQQITPNRSGWDGTYNGVQLPATDYWFTISYTEKGENKIFKSHFSLLR
jgi:gliding motility-associated-like protein